jgi:2-dehydropantoate 2-reductase
MRIAVIGAGGVGGYFGGRLAKAGIDTTFIVRGATLQALRSRGLRVESINGDFEVERVQVTDDASSVGPVDVVVLAVKAWQVPEAAETVKPLIGADTVAVPMENGMEAPEQLASVFGNSHVLGGLCGIVSFVVEPGHIRHIGVDPFVAFGELDNRRSDRAERLRAAFEQAGVRAEIPIDIHRSMWTKFLFIAPFSGVGSLARVPVGAWRTIPETRALIVRALEEVLAVANVRGVKLADDAIAMMLGRYDGLAPESTPSMQRDVMDGKPSELDSQLGAVVRMGRAAGVPTPVCELMVAALLPQEKKARGEVG